MTPGGFGDFRWERTVCAAGSRGAKELSRETSGQLRCVAVAVAELLCLLVVGAVLVTYCTKT